MKKMAIIGTISTAILGFTLNVSAADSVTENVAVDSVAVKIQGFSDSLRLARGKDSLIALYSKSSKTQLLDPQDSDLEKRIEINKANFLYVSAIKTINGKQKNGEFLDAAILQTFVSSESNLRLALWTDINLDFNLSRDTSVNIPSSYSVVTANIAYMPDQRVAGIFGGGVRIYEGVPLLGMQVGAISTSGAMLTSHLTVGYMHRIREADSSLSNNVGDNNLVISWSIHAPQVSYFKALRLKGDLVIPFEGQKNATHRIAMEVPLGGVLRW